MQFIPYVFYQAINPSHAEAGLMFMQEMIELSKNTQKQSEREYTLYTHMNKYTTSRDSQSWTKIVEVSNSKGKFSTRRHSQAQRHGQCKFSELRL